MASHRASAADQIQHCKGAYPAVLGSGAGACEAVAMADDPELSPNFIHVMRTTQQMHLQLSQMADQKASILMGATFVIFTIAIGQGHGAMPPLPLAILGVFAFASAVLAILVVVPVTGARARPQPLNLLFFGSFSQLDEADYVARLGERLETDRGVFELMARDIYQNGQVLRRKKYRMLRYAYRVFLLGLVLSFGAFLVQMVRAW
jgi:hypothetical protein